MAEHEPKGQRQPDHPGNHPRSLSKGSSVTGRRLGIAAGVLVLVGLLWWLMGGTVETPGQEHTLGEPAGVGTAAPDADTAADPAADPDDPQAAIGADPQAEPNSPQAADQADTTGQATNDDAVDEAEEGSPAAD